MNSLISFSHIQKITLNDPQIMRELINVFINENSRTLKKLDELLANENWSELKATAHKLKSSLALIGLEEHRALAEQLENTAGGNLNKTKKLVEELSKTLKQVIFEMGEKLATL